MGKAFLLIFSLFFYLGNTQNLSLSLTACYALDGNATDPISGLNGTLSSVTSTVNRFNNPNSSYFFNGTTSSYIRLPDSPLLKPSNAVSFSAWVKPGTLPTGAGSYILFTKNTATSNFEAYSLMIFNGGPSGYKFRAVKGDGSGSADNATGTTTVSAGLWYHVAISIDNSQIKLYVNGSLQATTTTSYNFNFDTNHFVYLGGTNETYNLPFLGTIDNARFYNRVITATEISQIYTQDPNCTNAPGAAINCDGLNDYIDPNILITSFSNNFTIETWARPTATHEIDVEATSGFPGLYNQRYLLWPTWRNAQGGIGISVGTNGVSVYEHGSNFMPPLLVWSGTLNAWTHIAVTVINKQPRLYINGILVKTGLTSTKTNLWPSLGQAGTFSGQVGGIGGGTYGYFQGDIDEFRLWSTVRTQSEIASNMNVEFNCPPTSLYAYYKFNHGIASANNTLVVNASDFSGNNFTAPLNNFLLNGNSSNWIAPGATLTPVSTVTLAVNASSVNICSASSVTLTASGANTFTWFPGGGTGSVIVVAPTSSITYTVVGSTAINCIGSATQAINVQSTPILSPSSTPSVLCAGSTATLLANNATTYTWQPGNLSGNQITVSPLSSTIYSVSGSNASGCVSPIYTVGVNIVTISVSAIANPSNICVGAQAVLTASGAVNYSWQPGNLGGSSVTVSPIVPSNYTVIGSDLSGCSNTAVVSVSVSSHPTISAQANSTLVCSGGPSTLSASGASTYTWQPGNLSGNPITVNPVASIVYTVSGSNASGCVSSIYTLGVNVSTINVNATATPSNICVGASAVLSASGASNYIWQPGNLSGSSLTVTPTSSSDYTVTGSDVSGCTSSAVVSVSISSNPVISVQASPSLVCSGSPSTLSAMGASNYSWQPGNLTGSSVVVFPNALTVYTVTGLSGTCTAIGNVTVDLGMHVSISSSGNLCSNSTVDLYMTASGAYNSVSWSGPGIVGATSSPTITINAGGVYSVAVSNTLTNCSGTATFFVTGAINTQTFSITPSSTVTCFPGPPVNMLVSLSANFTWFPANQVTPNTGPLVSVSPSVTTTYSVYAPLGACIASAAITISVNTTPTVQISSVSSSICEGTSATLTATGASNYTWTPGNSTSSLLITNPSNTTTFSLTGENGNCSSMSYFTLAVMPAPTIIASASPSTLCVGNSSTLTATGASTLFWTVGDLPTPTSSVIVTPTISTNYSVVGLSPEGCSASATLEVEVVNSFPIIAGTSSSVICAGETVTLSVSGSSTYTWLPTFQTTPVVIITPTASLTYTVIGSNSVCSQATVFVGVTNCISTSFGITNLAEEPEELNGGLYRIRFTITVVNNSADDLTQVDLQDNLGKTFIYPITYTISKTPSVSSSNSLLKINPLFDGRSDEHLLLSETSTLIANKRDTISLSVILDPNGYEGVLKNSVVGFALDKNAQIVSDSSNNGFAWDPDQDGDPTNNNEITLITINRINLFIPEGFSPDDDGINDYFIISGLNNRTIKLSVFNRWGNIVYEKNNYDNSWDGTPNKGGLKLGNGKLPEGTYYYILQFLDGKKETKTGFLVLRR